MNASFADLLKTEVARMQAAHPEREGEIARACALISQGFVTAVGDGTARVLSSDLQRRYTVNGACDCQGAQHGKPCKHRAAWLLYQHIQKKLAEQTAEAAPATDTLPEAPASINFKAIVAGFETQVTLRDTDEARLLARMAALAKSGVVKPIPKPAPRQGQGQWRKGGNYASASR